MSSHEELRRIALAEFAKAGYVATSLQRVAEIAGLSKSSVLYHFASKEALLEAAIGPAIDRMGVILDSIVDAPLTDDRRGPFVEAFVDLLLEHRLEVATFLVQGPSLVGVPVIERANELVERIADYFAAAAPTVEGQLRFGIALGGAAYILGAQPGTRHKEELPADEIRAALITILTELLAPVPVRSTTP
jgi:AcrR family transcriptional regulator